MVQNHARGVCHASAADTAKLDLVEVMPPFPLEQDDRSPAQTHVLEPPCPSGIFVQLPQAHITLNHAHLRHEGMAAAPDNEAANHRLDCRSLLMYDLLPQSAAQRM